MHHCDEASLSQRHETDCGATHRWSARDTGIINILLGAMKACARHPTDLPVRPREPNLSAQRSCWSAITHERIERADRPSRWCSKPMRAGIEKGSLAGPLVRAGGERGIRTLDRAF